MPLAAHAEPVVIVSAASRVNTMGAEQLADIFLGKTNYSAGSASAVPVDLAARDPLREAFYAKKIGMTMPQLRAYWSRRIFTGKGQPPLEAGSSEAVKKLIAAHPDFIGYVDEKVVDASVKIVTVRK